MWRKQIISFDMYQWKKMFLWKRVKKSFECSSKQVPALLLHMENVIRRTEKSAEYEHYYPILKCLISVCIYIYIWLSEAEGHFFLSETPLLLFCKTFASKKQRKYYDFFICHEYFKFNYLKLLWSDKDINARKI